MTPISISTPEAPQAIGPYSQAIVASGLVFCSGQVALKPGTTELLSGGVADQTQRVLQNLKAVLEASGSSLRRVVKTTVYLTTMEHFAAMNEVYAQFFGDCRPARATVAVHQLPKGALVEIDAIALG